MIYERIHVRLLIAVLRRLVDLNPGAECFVSYVANHCLEDVVGAQYEYPSHDVRRSQRDVTTAFG